MGANQRGKQGVILLFLGVVSKKPCDKQIMRVLFQKHGMNTRTGWCWQMFMKKATVRITVQDRHGSAGLIGRKWYFPQMSRVFSFGLKQALWMQIGPQMLLPSRFGSPQLPAAAHLASVHSPDQQRRPHNRHFRPWTRRNTPGGGGAHTSAPPLCLQMSPLWWPQPTMVQVASGLWQPS